MLALCLEASHQRGMGHLFRCLSLARVLAARSVPVRFYVNDFAPALAILREAGFAATIVPLGDEDRSWVSEYVRSDRLTGWVNDRLNTGLPDAERVHETGAFLATFDDRGAGSALADLNIVAFPADDEDLFGRRLLKGIEFLVLDPSISLHRRQRGEWRSTVVSMGGSDTSGVTVDVVRALRERKRAATVVLGPGFKHDDALHAVLNDDFVVRRAVPSLVAEFARHDLAITAGGITPCEANGAGLPVIVIATEPWEVRTGVVLARLGGAFYAGPRDAIDFSLFDRLPPIGEMSRAALATVPIDGAERIVHELLSLNRRSKLHS